MIASAPSSDEQVARFLSPAGRSRTQQAIAELREWLGARLSTGEHGIGAGKRAKLVQEYGTEVVELMRAIKNAWDPRGILNPGKIFL